MSDTHPPKSEAASWRGWLARFGRGALDVVYPAHCPGCGAATGDPGTLCGPCWSAMPFISRPYCERLGTPFAVDIGGTLLSPTAIATPPAFDRARAVALHDGAARDFVHKLKFADSPDLARPMGVLMAAAGRGILDDADLIIPVPLHWTRLFWRRLNQASVLANVIAGTSGVTVAHDLLIRRKRTPHQVGLTRGQRAANLQGAFHVPADKRPFVEERRIVLVDDVRTTGSTLNACASVLRRAGAARIDVLTFTLVADSGALPI